ncbi:MAG: DUF2236 domain-containing protein [Rhizobiales bacterium]|nr:DUF2236 domain-containing protein [Hyphomicrobiales bacterium]
MSTALEQVHQRIAYQKAALPVMYGDVDFTITPERFADAPTDSMLGDRLNQRQKNLPPEMIERVRAYTMLGDVTADAYAALMHEHGFRKLVDMLQLACDKGIEAVPDAPKELVALIAEMEKKPEWLDMDLVAEGARLNRLPMAILAPWFIRGSFLATFLNKYSALPMALTGTLSGGTAAKRVNETATFFTITTLPGALERHGEGFKAAAMVRLMHSMVRYNVLRRVGGWDVPVYGIPIPQLDQMPAGLIDVFLLSYEMLAEGRTEFTADERARVEFSRYRCYLLGLPEDLLLDTPEGIANIMDARNATLRKGFDDATCGELIRATISAYTLPDRSFGHRLFHAIEQRFARLVFIRQFLNGNAEEAAAIGVIVNRMDYVIAAVVGAGIALQMASYRLARKVPGLNAIAERRLTAKLRKLLDRYGHAEFTTDAEAYRPARPKAA